MNWRTLFAFTAASAAGALLYAWAGERPRMTLQTYRIPLPQAAGLRILHLADQHFGEDNWIRRSRLRRMKAIFSTIQPDLILFSGDFLHNDAGLDAVEILLQMLPPARLGRYAVLGNHDYVEYSYTEFIGSAWRTVMGQRTPAEMMVALVSEGREMAKLLMQIYRNDRLRFACVPNNTSELRALLELYDVRLLENEALPLPEHPHLWLAGVDDPIEGSPNLVQALTAAPPDATIILLTHNPDLAYAAPPGRVAIAIAGHTHGGQVVLPGVGAIHTQGALLPRAHPAGLFDDLPGGGRMVVSRGMGESTPFRFRCPPEIVVIDFTKTNKML
ncbi:MAG: hypothetical protein GXP42_19090 [Chloroflexi bacterium]|nr:hypothetical protein [Chloroflexota bacterium]